MSGNFFTGYSNDKPSSKVINPPGGRSNNIFGTHEDNANTVANNKSRNQTSSIFFGDDSTPQNQVKPASVGANNRMKSTIFGDDTSKENNSKDNRKGYNPITGKSYETEQPATESHHHHAPPVVTHAAPAPDHGHNRHEEEQQQQHGKPLHTSSRVLQPPGGKSHGLW